LCSVHFSSSFVGIMGEARHLTRRAPGPILP
jgi:hypothetical protein